MKKRKRIQFRHLYIIIAAWIVAGFFITIYDYLAITTYNSLGLSAKYSFWLSLAYNTGSGFIGALLGGSLLVFYINEKLINKSYAYTIVTVCVSYLLVIGIIVILLGYISTVIQTGKKYDDPLFRSTSREFIQDSSRAKNILTWFLIVTATQLILQINNKFGYGVFKNFITGKYYTPKEEYKIIMFLDLNCSTTIAEKLGNTKYHELLRDFFSDITNPILDNNGEIYQYVGDEVVVAWKNRNGTDECVKCYFDIMKVFEMKKEYYISKYEIFPQFKAAFHSGEVVAGEVGIIKRDITFSGDVLNTTSRILTKCKEFKAGVIVSSSVLSGIKHINNFSVRHLGNIKLRGKSEELGLSELHYH